MKTPRRAGKFKISAGMMHWYIDYVRNCGGPAIAQFNKKHFCRTDVEAIVKRLEEKRK